MDTAYKTVENVTETPDTATKNTHIKEKKRKEKKTSSLTLLAKEGKKEEILWMKMILRQRNLAGLLDTLRLYRISPAEQYAIVLKSNYGEIGGKVWQEFGVIHAVGGKIKLPGHYLLSVLNR